MYSKRQMKKIFLVIFLIVVCAVVFSCLIKYKQKNYKEYSLLNNKNYEYVFAIIRSSAENKKKNYLSDFYYAKNKTDKGDIEKYNNLVHRNKKINSVTRAEIYYSLGNMYMKDNDVANAVYCYKKALFFAPYGMETKYNIKIFVDFAERINVPEKLLEHNNQNSVKQLQLFFRDKEILDDKQIENTKTELKNIYAKNIKLNENIKAFTDKNRENLKKEILSLEKEKESLEKQLKSLKEKTAKQEIEEIQNIKKEILKFSPNLYKSFTEVLTFWKKLENPVIKRVVNNFSATETKTVQDKYFVTDLFLHKKNIWENLLADFQNIDKQKYNGVIERNINFINHKKINIFNALNEKEKSLFSEIVKTDKKATEFFNRRAKHLFEEKDNISYLLKDTSSKKKEIYSELGRTKASNEQKKKNLQKELDKIKEKEKALRQESADCSKDLAELEIIQDNILTYNEINLLEIKKHMLEERINICKSLKDICEYVKMFYEKQKVLLNKRQDILKNTKTFDCSDLKKYSESSVVCNENFNNTVTEQKYLFELNKLLLSNYKGILAEINRNIETDDNNENGEILTKLKIFTDKELKIADDKEKSLNKSFEYDKICSAQTIMSVENLSARKKIEKLKGVLEEKELIKNLFPKKQPEQNKVKSKKYQEKVIVSKMKNYEVNTGTVKEEIEEVVSASQKEKKKKNKKKK